MNKTLFSINHNWNHFCYKSSKSIFVWFLLIIPLYLTVAVCHFEVLVKFNTYGILIKNQTNKNFELLVTEMVSTMDFRPHCFVHITVISYKMNYPMRNDEKKIVANFFICKCVYIYPRRGENYRNIPKRFFF